MRFVLAGQPNSGKSTIFNSVAGYRAAIANFPGSSISFTFSRALILGREVEVVDLPGIYSLTSSKEDAGPALGLDGLIRAVQESEIPLVAIGGISVENLASVLETGVHGVAILSGVCLAEDPAAATRRLREIIDRFPLAP